MDMTGVGGAGTDDDISGADAAIAGFTGGNGAWGAFSGGAAGVGEGWLGATAGNCSFPSSVPFSTASAITVSAGDWVTGTRRPIPRFRSAAIRSALTSSDAAAGPQMLNG